MNNTKRTDKGFWLTLLLSLIVIALAVSAFIPTFIERAFVQAESVQNVDGEAMRVLDRCNAYVAEHSFKTTMKGAIKARVVGVPYTQKIHGRRAVDGDKYSEVAESVSAFVKAAVKREKNGNVYYVSQGTYKNKKFKYQKAQELSYPTYVEKFGQPFTGVVKYNLDSAVTKAVKVNDNTYKYTLDPSKATLYSRNEVKTMLGGKMYPQYKSVEFTLTTDGDRPIKVISVENFRIEKFGGTDCTAKYEESFAF